MFRQKLFMMLVLGFSMLTVSCMADDDDAKGTALGFKELPAAVQQAALKYFETAKIKEIEKKAEKDTVQYGVEGISNGSKLDVVFASDGTVVRTSLKVNASALPELARKALSVDYPAGVINEVEKIVRTSYKVKIVVKGEKREIEVNAAGDIDDENDNDGINDNKNSDKDNDKADKDDDEEKDDD